MKKEKIINGAIFTGAVATILLAVLVIYMLLLKIMGHSPSEIELLVGFIGVMATGTFTSYGLIIKNRFDIGKLTGKFDEFSKRFDNLSQEVKEGFSSLKKEIRRK